MHRNAYRGRKLGRERDQRRALLKGLAESLILNESIETTLPKAKEVRPMVEKLVTKARKGTLHARRQVISALSTKKAAAKLFEEIAPAMQRESGYLRIEKTRLRRGDMAQMARVSFVDPIEQPQPKAKTSKKKPAKATKPAAKKVAKSGDKK